MRRPWMPLYVADYRADTAHLGTAQHGAYLLLIMHYWQTGGLPDDDHQLARIVCATLAEWRAMRPTIEAFFEPGWRHKRVEEEIALAEVKYQRRARAGSRGGSAKAASHAGADPPSNATALLEHCQSNAVAGLYQPQPQPQKRDEGSGAPAREARPNVPLISQQAFALAGDYRRAAKIDPDDHRWMGLAYTAQVWIDRGYDRALILSIGADVAARIGDKPLVYHARAVENAHADQARRVQAPRLPLVQVLSGTEQPNNAQTTAGAGDWKSRRDDRHAALAELHASVAADSERASGTGEGRGEPPVQVVPHARRG